ncbi:predicted protein [Uncinocarpus reesii 1704]|uniref:Uncharacterized protein n=1 Tax=Uncinocarpus reesii (strain UAMH 1704) TaxID=336963 RepID=C4JSD8_UNCRE|nr:uncharacterized protein UREG_05377 [Uncinocarpus reesii 1704]EEP80535.1 predicted protein [Uncinocarpus reesii 1704]
MLDATEEVKQDLVGAVPSEDINIAGKRGDGRLSPVVVIVAFVNWNSQLFSVVSINSTQVERDANEAAGFNMLSYFRVGPNLGVVLTRVLGPGPSRQRHGRVGNRVSESEAREGNKEKMVGNSSRPRIQQPGKRFPPGMRMSKKK